MILIPSVVVSLCLLGALWLTTINVWWWSLAVPVIVLAILGVVAYISARAVTKRLRPELTKAQASDVVAFVDKLERVASNLQTPMFMIIFHVMRDVVLPRKNTFIGTAANDSVSLREDFLKLQKNFNQ